jgi:altronate hydrolase
MKRFLKINEVDNVAVAIADDLKKGEVITLEGRPITLHEDIQSGHKFAIKEIAEGEEVIKYGYPIGHAIHPIKAGEWVHSHNLKTGLNDDLAYSYHPKIQHSNYQKNDELRVMGYLRKNGDMGIRNELWIVPSVGCVNGQAQAIVERIKSECDCSHLDDVRTYTHNYGCSQLGEDHANTQKALAALIKHPNAGGVLVLGLGCENNQIALLKEVMGEWDDSRIKFLIAQEVEDEVETGFQICRELVENCRNDKREPLPLNLLRVGLKCGGSDGFSGITANPLVGLFSDWLITQGGTTLLTEVPEMFGAETILMDRAINKEVFEDTVALINNFKSYYRRYDQPIYENPSPGNKKGGITTLEEKSLGCVQKGGMQPVVDVLHYCQPVTKQGLNLLQAPGNDLIASSALALSGCQMVLFTTGRGTPFGSFVPTMKISTNSQLAKFKSNWIDFNAGALIEGQEEQQSVLSDLIDKILKTANGDKLKHEKAGFKEIAIFKTGVTL